MMMSGNRLRDMIRAVRSCKTAAEERAVVAKECAALRNSFKENDQDYRHRNVAKLMFIHMLGYPTHFGQMECLKLIASPGFPEKRIGYLGLMLLLDERQEVLMLVTNSLKNDLSHSNQFIVGLALCALGNICSTEMARDLAPEVERLLSSNNSYIRKKAALCTIRIIRKVPDLMDYITVSASGLLTDKHHGVLIAGVKLATELCAGSPSALEHYRKQTPVLVRILKNLVISGYAPEYDVGGITDPFLQIRILRLLRLIGKGDADSSDIMSDILAQVATNTEATKTAGNAILYECVATIMGVEAIGGLRVLAINILGRFLAHRENNVRYVALNTLVRVVAVDTQAVQRHRNTIVECVKDSDVSIRRRALDLVYALVNENNIKTLTKELLEYLKVSDPEFKGDLTTRICALVQRFAPSKVWHVDTLIKVMVEAGKYVKEDVCRFLIVLITNAPEIHGYSVRAFYRAFQKWKGQESLALVTVWCIGEFGEMLVNHQGELEGEEPLTVTESDAVDVLETVLKGSLTPMAAKAYALTSLLKLSSRFPSCSQRIEAIVDLYKGCIVLELQQRSVEFSAILTRHTDIKASLVDRMPALDEALYRAKKEEGAAALGDSRLAPASVEHAANGANGIVKAAAPQAPLLADLLDLSMDDPSSAPAQAPSSTDGGLFDLLGGGPTTSASVPSASGADMLLDLLSLGGTNPSSSIPQQNPPPPAPSSQTVDPLSAAFPQFNSTPPPALPVDPLSALMGGETPLISSLLETPPAPQPAPPQAPAAPVDPFAGLGLTQPTPAVAPVIPPAPSFAPIVALESNGLKITFEFTKPAGNPQATIISASYSNSSASPLSDFVCQAAVPKFMQLQLEPASASVVPAGSDRQVTQTIRVTNTMHGQKALVMKLRVSYRVNGEDKLEQGQVNNFPPGL